MISKLKGLVGLGILALSFALVTIFSTETRADNRVKKYEVLHNGQHLCLPAPGRDGHLKEHPTDVLIGCCDNCDLPPEPDPEPDPTPDPSPVPPPQ